MEKSLVEQNLELAKTIKDKKITERNKPNFKLMAKAIYDHVHYSNM